MNLFTIAIASLSIFLGFFIQGVIGFGNFVTLPLLITVLPIQKAIPFMSIFLFLFSAILVPKIWKDIDRKVLVELGVSGIVGLFAGVYILAFANPVILKKLLGVVIILYVAYTYIKKKKIERLKRWGVLFGLLGGFFGGLYNAGGPLFVTYITNKIDKAKVERATTLGVLGIMNFTKIPVLVKANLLTFDLFSLAIYAIPAFLIAIYLGNKLYGKLDENLFKTLILTFLALSGVSLLIK